MTEELAKTFEPLISSISKNFYGVDKEDLKQAGLVGLINAYNHYNEQNNTKFSTFAYQYIFGEMYNLALKMNIIKQSRDTLKLTKLIEKAKIYLTQVYKREPSIKEIANYLEISENDIINAINNTTTILSLDKLQEDDANLYNLIGSKQDDLDSKLDIEECLKNLDIDSQNIIRLRYYNDFTQQEIADKLGISQVKVSRYEAKSLKKLKTYLN